MVLAAALLSGCSSVLPWAREAPREVNLAFTLERNVVYLTTAAINGRTGRYIFASAAAQTVIDPSLAQTLATRRYRLQLNARDALGFNPVVLPLGGVADAAVGADVWGGAAVTIDYRGGLLTYQRDGIHPEYMTLYPFQTEPTVRVEVNGTAVDAIVDTSSPDTLVLPRTAGTDRGRARVSVGGVEFGDIDVGFAETTRPRIGNRLLSKFLVSIDYGRHEVGLWRDPRNP